MQEGVVFNIQKYSIQDGPGIRTTVFLKGCPLRCSWCHNPESQAPDPEVYLNPARCVRCHQCVEFCPQRNDGRTALDDETRTCLSCGACVEVCPAEARQMVGRRMSVFDVMATVLQDRIFYDDSGGGVTFSGGEPLMQPQFLVALLAACRREGLHTAVDTCGFAPRDQLLAVAELTDLFLYDVKTLDSDVHQEFTGVSNEVILDNLHALGRAHDNIWVRIPIVPKYNDNWSQLEAVARFIATIRGVTQVNLLPFHATYQHKLHRAVDAGDQTHETNGRKAVALPTTEDLTELAEIFAKLNLKTGIGG